MHFFSLQTPTPDFSNSTLVLPTESIGNVGQLAIDLITSTTSCPKVGYLEDEAIVPIIGGGEDLSLSLEVYLFQSSQPQDNVVLVQQRSPIVKNQNKQFAKRLVEWIVKSNFKRVVLLSSRDASLRIDCQLNGTQFRYVSLNSKDDSSLQSRGFVHLESEEGISKVSQAISRHGTFPSRFFEEFELRLEKGEAAPEILGLICFCNEGDNRPEARAMSDGVNVILGMANGGEIERDAAGIRWKEPASWQKLFGSDVGNYSILY
eukprot:TRINITY_DN2396_c0_g1_i2.p1 TRINITY_DN2396_c0_g1~~TRINITY_DN2396_c0_g1_i2.p1  ORF type:complete len:262 (-),score=98.10 TRINITY_DN2396_c0_g1_i2:70-855(-)